MNPELSFIDQLRSIATDPAARGLLDDAAVLDLGGTRLVLTLDTLVEGVHFLAEDRADSVAWKLVAVNVSDLAAKGAEPLAALTSYTLTGDAAWDSLFIKGLGEALDHFGIALIGGDTVSAHERSIGLTLVGEARGFVPSRSGAHEGDALFVTGIVGDAGLGLAIARELARGMGGELELVTSSAAGSSFSLTLRAG